MAGVSRELVLAVASRGNRACPPVPPTEEATMAKPIDPDALPAFERTSKRRKGYPSETRVKRRVRMIIVIRNLKDRLCNCRDGALPVNL